MKNRAFSTIKPNSSAEMIPLMEEVEFKSTFSTLTEYLSLIISIYPNLKPVIGFVTTI